jgi:hypothetical protein
MGGWMDGWMGGWVDGWVIALLTEGRFTPSPIPQLPGHLESFRDGGPVLCLCSTLPPLWAFEWTPEVETKEVKGSDTQISGNQQEQVQCLA